MTQRNPTQFVKMCPKCNKEQYYKNIGSAQGISTATNAARNFNIHKGLRLCKNLD